MWPSDFLVFFWIVPAVMTLFLSVRDSDSRLEWLRFFDFVQVCTLALAIELTQIYVPSQWQASGQSMELRALHAAPSLIAKVREVLDSTTKSSAAAT